MSNELPVESPVLVNEVDRQPHEGVAGSWRPHICGEGGTCEVSLYRVDDVEDLFLDLGRLHLHQLRVSGAMLEIHALVKQFQDPLKAFKPHHTEGNPRLRQEIHDCVIELLLQFVNVPWNAVLKPYLLRLSAVIFEKPNIICIRIRSFLKSRIVFGFVFGRQNTICSPLIALLLGCPVFSGHEDKSNRGLTLSSNCPLSLFNLYIEKKYMEGKWY